jgi:amidase
MGKNELWKLSASKIASLIKNREISAVEAVSSSIERVQSKNEKINAIVDNLSKEALVEAEQLDALALKGEMKGPLHGVPITVKENIDQKGYTTPNGVVALKDLVAPGNSPVVDNLKDAGAVIIGRTNTPEFSMRGTTDNVLHGRTFNPWNDWASPGGSSGGASAAVMSGMGCLAHGNDIAGSLRIPSTATGATTVKPGLGRVPAYNPSQKQERGLIAQLMSVQGLIAREVKDVRLGMQSLIKYDPRDPWMVEVPFNSPQIEKHTKIGYTKETLGERLDPAVEKALESAKEALEDAGYLLEEIELPEFKEVSTFSASTLFGELKILHQKDYTEYGSETFNKIANNYFELTDPFEGEDFLLGMSKRSYFFRLWNLFFQKYPLILTPFLLYQTYKWDRDAEGLEGTKEVLAGMFYAHTMNYLGIPAGVISSNYNNGLPVGVQIIAPRYREDWILDACEAIESRLGIMADKLFSKET